MKTAALAIVNQSTQGIRYGDLRSLNSHSAKGSERLAIKALLDTFLLKNDHCRAAQNRPSGAPTIVRLSLFDQDLQSNFATQIAAFTEQMEPETYLICELNFSSAWLADSQSSSLYKENLLKLCALTDLLICNIQVYSFLVGHNLEISLANLSRAAAKQSFSQSIAKGLFISDSAAAIGWYIEQNRLGKFCWANSSQSQHCATDHLSAVITLFMLQGKRSCDALVLALAFIDQQPAPDLDKSLQQPNFMSFNNFSWPSDLAHYPTLNTLFDHQQPLKFKSTNTLSLGLYPVVDSIEWLDKLLKLGVPIIQLRIKDTPVSQLDPLIEQAAALGEQYQAKLFINDHWQLAIKHRCYGVHLGQEDLEETDLTAIAQAGLRLGVSTHSEYEWLRALAICPSYIAMGTVYPTTTKPAILIGLNNLKRWCRTLATHFPIVAIGGIKLENIDEVLKSGVGSIAVVTAITRAHDYKLATQLLSDKQQTQCRK
ncbi:MAG: hypothetical protein OFPII_09670 [Osedax symbiont Rs1]|nr:MAG: hypothetical protein OFPII_09670 [Osedax symbiont Rs1]